jgi:hypothetical protein
VLGEHRDREKGRAGDGREDKVALYTLQAKLFCATARVEALRKVVMVVVMMDRRKEWKRIHGIENSTAKTKEETIANKFNRYITQAA